MPEATLQTDLFESVPDLPEGMRYWPGLISADEERTLLGKMPALPFKEFEFHGFLGKRRTVSFGWHYDFNGGGLKRLASCRHFSCHFATSRRVPQGLSLRRSNTRS